MKPLIYYAHSKLDYNTPREKAEIKHLSKYFRVFNPNTELGELGAMTPYLHAVWMCHHIVVSPHVELYVGRGVFCEICAALAYGQTVQVLCYNKAGEIIPGRFKGLSIHDPKDWKVHYGKLEVIT